MVKGRGKGKKQPAVTANNDVENAKEENNPASKRRGRPQKPLKDEVEDVENSKIANAVENANSSMTAVSGAKRKQVTENSDSVKDENGSKGKTITEGFVKSVGFRQIGSRRKSKPHRAAEVGVKCK